MRPGVILFALLVAAGMVGVALWLSKAPPASAAVDFPTPVSRSPAPGQPARVAGGFNLPPSSLPAPRPAEPASPVNDILADLKKPGSEIQQDALRRARELDDRSMIPKLQEVATQTDDESEKAAILDTIDFLNLPDAAETLAEAHTARTEAGLPNLPRSPTNRWTGQPFAAPSR